MTLIEFHQLKPLYEQSNHIARNGKMIELVVERGYQKMFYLCDDFIVQSTWNIKSNEWIGFSAFELDFYLENFITLESLFNG